MHLLGQWANCPAPHTINLPQLPRPCGPSRRPHLLRPPRQRPLPLSRTQSPGPSPAPGAYPPRAAPRPHSLRAGAEEPGQPSRRGREVGHVPLHPRRCQARASPTYAVFLLLRRGPHGRAGRSPAGAAAGGQRAGDDRRDGRGPGCGAPRGKAGAVRRRGAVGGASLAGRPGCHRHRRTPRPDSGTRRAAQQPWAGDAGKGSPPVRRHRPRAAVRLLAAPSLASRRRRGSACLSGLAGRPRMRRSLARGGSQDPGSRHPSPRANPRDAAAGQRREICERLLDSPTREARSLRPPRAFGCSWHRRGSRSCVWKATVPPASPTEMAARPLVRERRTSKGEGGASLLNSSRCHSAVTATSPEILFCHPEGAGRMGSPQRNQVKSTGSWTPSVLYLGQGRQHLLSSFVELAAVVSVWGLDKLSSLSSKEAFSLRTLFSCVHQTHASAGHRSPPPAILTEFQLPPRTFFLLLLRIPSL